MAQYLLLLRGGWTEPMSPEEMQAAFNKYMAWGEQLRSEGKYISAEPLKQGGKILVGSGNTLQITDGPFTETKEIVAGYYLLEVADNDAALQTAKECPHLLYGGSVELRETGME